MNNCPKCGCGFIKKYEDGLNICLFCPHRWTKREFNFKIGDIVQYCNDGLFYEVVGYMHDEEKLFIFDENINKEREINFNEVDKQYREVE